MTEAREKRKRDAIEFDPRETKAEQSYESYSI